jgi:hypothetical protein
MIFTQDFSDSQFFAGLTLYRISFNAADDGR